MRIRRAGRGRGRRADARERARRSFYNDPSRPRRCPHPDRPMKHPRLLLATALAAALAFPVSAQTPAAETPLTSLPYTPGLDASAMDKSADPCVDFYRFACGGWIRNNPIPPDESSWSVYGKLAWENQRFLWGILDGLAKITSGRSLTQQKIGDYFAACMDEAAVEKSGGRALKPYLDRIFRMKSKRDLAALLAQLHLATGGSGFFFVFGSNQDFADSTRVIAFAGAGGIGLPDRDFYTKDDDKSKELRARYAAHVA